MQLDAQSILAVVGEKLAEERAARVALQSRLETLQRVPGPQPELFPVPDDIAEQVAKAIAVLKESPVPATQALVLNINTAAVSKNKTITTRRDAGGNLVAEVIEQG